jgi:hypothetical protein
VCARVGQPALESWLPYAVWMEAGEGEEEA